MPVIKPKESSPTIKSPYKKSWKAKYQGKWYPVTNVEDVGPSGNVYHLEGYPSPIPQNKIEDLDIAASSIKPPAMGPNGPRGFLGGPSGPVGLKRSTLEVEFDKTGMPINNQLPRGRQVVTPKESDNASSDTRRGGFDMPSGMIEEPSMLDKGFPERGRNRKTVPLPKEMKPTEQFKDRIKAKYVIKVVNK